MKNMIFLEKTDFEVFAWKISTLMETKDVLTSFINRYRKIKIHKTKNTTIYDCSLQIYQKMRKSAK